MGCVLGSLGLCAGVLCRAWISWWLQQLSSLELLYAGYGATLLCCGLLLAMLHLEATHCLLQLRLPVGQKDEVGQTSHMWPCCTASSGLCQQQT
jgi:hypothetical protein